MAHSSIDALLATIRKTLEAVLEEAREEGRSEVRAMLSGIVSGPSPRRTRRSAKAAPAAKKASSKKRKSAWTRLTDDEYIARVNGIRKGRGMALLTPAEAAAKIAERHGAGPKKKRKKRKSAWDTYTPEQRKAHLAAMKSGRKKAAKKRKRSKR